MINDIKVKKKLNNLNWVYEELFGFISNECMYEWMFQKKAYIIYLFKYITYVSNYKLIHVHLQFIFIIIYRKIRVHLWQRIYNISSISFNNFNFKRIYCDQN